MVRYKSYFNIFLLLMVDLAYIIQHFYSMGSLFNLILGNLFLMSCYLLKINKDLLRTIGYFGQLMIVYVSMRIIATLIFRIFNNWVLGIFITLTLLLILMKILSNGFVSEIKSTVLRIVCLYITFLYFIYMQFIFSDAIYGNNVLIKSEILGAIVSVSFVIMSMKRWGYKMPRISVQILNIPWKEYLIAIVLIILVVGWGWLHSDGSLLDNLVKYRYKPINFSASNLLVSLEAGIAEETVFRYGVLTIILYKLKQTFRTINKKIYLTVLIDACLFGFGHLLNFVSGESLIACCFQAFDATISGIVFALIYLYTQQFLFPVLFHFLYDLIGAGFSLISFITIIDLPFSSITGYVGIRYLIWIMLIIFMLTGKRYKKIIENFNKM